MKIYPGIIEPQHLIDPRRMALLKERYAEEREGRLLYCCNQDWMKKGGPILWNAFATSDMSKTPWQMQKTPHGRRFGEPFRRPIISFGAMSEYHPISTRDLSRLHHFGKNVSLPGFFLGYELIAGGWKGDTLIEDLDDLEKMDASAIYLRRIKAKEISDQTRGDEFIFLVADGTAKLSGRDYEFQEPTLRREPTVRSEDFSGELQGESSESQPTHQ